MHPYGMQPSDSEVLEAIRNVNTAYKGLKENEADEPNDFGPGGPLMFYSEFLAVRTGYVDKMPKEDRLNLTLDCVRRYLVMKSSPRLDIFDKEKAFQFRPFEARVKKGADQMAVMEVMAELRNIDRGLGMPRKLQDGGCGTLMYHDWHLMFELGVPRLRQMEPLRKLGEEEKEHFVSVLKDALRAACEGDEGEYE